MVPRETAAQAFQPWSSKTGAYRKAQGTAREVVEADCAAFLSAKPYSQTILKEQFANNVDSSNQMD
jgi:hypothetical protein